MHEIHFKVKKHDFLWLGNVTNPQSNLPTTARSGFVLKGYLTHL